MRSEFASSPTSTSDASSRLEWFKQYQVSGNARQTCKRIGISRKTFYKWLKRYKLSGGDINSLVNLPRTPHHFPRRTSDAIRAQVIELRNASGYGPRRIRKELRDKRAIQLSERTIWKIIRSMSIRPRNEYFQDSHVVVVSEERTPIAA
jgi:transposase